MKFNRHFEAHCKSCVQFFHCPGYDYDQDNVHDSDHRYGHGLKSPFTAAKKPLRPVERVETKENNECANHLGEIGQHSNTMKKIHPRKRQELTADPVCPV